MSARHTHAIRFAQSTLQMIELVFSSNDPAGSRPAPPHGFRAFGFYGFRQQHRGRRANRSMAQLAFGGPDAAWSARLRQDASRPSLAGARVSSHHCGRSINRRDVTAPYPRGSTADRDRRCGAGLGARPASPLQFLHRAPRQPVDHRLPPAWVVANSARRPTFALACSPGCRDRRSRRRAARCRSRQAFRRSSASRRTRRDRLFANAHRSILRGRREDRGPSRRCRTMQWRSGYHPTGSQGVETTRPSAFVAA